MFVIAIAKLNLSFLILLSSYGVVGAGKANEMFSEPGSNVEERSC